MHALPHSHPPADFRTHRYAPRPIIYRAAARRAKAGQSAPRGPHPAISFPGAGLRASGRASASTREPNFSAFKQRAHARACARKRASNADHAPCAGRSTRPDLACPIELALTRPEPRDALTPPA